MRLKKENPEHKSVMNVFKKFTDAYGRRDIDDITGLFINEPKPLFIGTGIDEECVGTDEVKKQFMRDFNQSEKLEMDVKWHHVSVKESMAWLASEIDVHTKVLGKKMTIFCRLTAALERCGDEWLFANMHISTPSTVQKKGESFPTCDLY